MTPKQSELAKIAARCRGGSARQRVSQALILWNSCKKALINGSLPNPPTVEELVHLCLELPAPHNSPADAIEIWMCSGESVKADQDTSRLSANRNGMRANMVKDLGLDVDLALDAWLAKVLPRKRSAARQERFRQYLKYRMGAKPDDLIDLSKTREEVACMLASLDGTISVSEQFLAWHKRETKKAAVAKSSKGGKGRHSKVNSAKNKKSQN